MENYKPYSVFSQYYDEILNYVNYERWKNFILSEFVRQKSKNPSHILDLGSGTGSLLRQFKDVNAKMTGIDSSQEMLNIAHKLSRDINYIHAKISDFFLNTKADLAISTHDVINYLTDKNELIQHFKCVHSNLSNDSLYFFDITSEYNIIRNFHNRVINNDFRDGNLQWSNEYNPESHILKSELIFFTQEKKTKETHFQKYYSPSEIFQILKDTKFKVLKIGSDYQKWKLEKNTCLINFLVQPVSD
ncbi:MAG: class I SAM-dependent methyltransferase [Leptospiraceae bacterium]|nr:methyltransferase domain-containing protein [Leptospiraceae bacterium]MCK6380018.1 class I SAM-dependent methyltransferase [Leptospiraceae bacterium]NUM40321.1 methyltransferase domain-containing protein [Leptospiraceae bacterium]